MNASNLHRKFYQRGVAVVTALLLTTLAVTIVANLFWQQQVQVRSIENQRLQAQKKWISRGVLSFSRLAVKLGTTSVANHLGEPWAQPIKDFRLSDFMAAGYREADDVDPMLSGQMSDAQGRFNLTNLATNGVVVPKQLDTFSRLLINLELRPELAKTVAENVLASQPSPSMSGRDSQAPSSSNPVQPGQPTPPPAVGAGGDGKKPLSGFIAEVQSLRLTQVEDLVVLPGFTPEIVKKLSPHVIILPAQVNGGSSQINLNTASPEVLSAASGLSVQEATAIRRSKLFFRDTIEFRADSDRLFNKATDVEYLTTSSDYYLVNGHVSLAHATWMVDALIFKSGQRGRVETQVIWAREN